MNMCSHLLGLVLCLKLYLSLVVMGGNIKSCGRTACMHSLPKPSWFAYTLMCDMAQNIHGTEVRYVSKLVKIGRILLEIYFEHSIGKGPNYQAVHMSPLFSTIMFVSLVFFFVCLSLRFNFYQQLWSWKIQAEFMNFNSVPGLQG